MSEERKLQFRGGIGMSLIPVAIFLHGAFHWI